MKGRSALVGAASLAVWLAASSPARADGPTPSPPASTADAKKACGKSYENAQVLMQKDSFREARRELEVCTAPACAAFIREECAKWTREVDSGMPSLVLVVTDAAGAAVTPTALTVDGVAVAVPAPGASLELDPGTHLLEAQRGDGRASLTVAVARGKKNVATKLVFAGASTETSSPAAPAPGAHGDGGSLALPIAIGGVGVVALTASLVLGASASSDLDDLDSCKGHCAQKDVDRIDTKTTVATVLFGVSLVALGVSTYFILTRDKRAARTAPRALFTF